MPAFLGCRLRLTTLSLLVLSCVLSVAEVLGWGCAGHMIVAEIALRQLDPENEEKIEAMATRFAQSGPFPWSPDVVQAACWPDDVRRWQQNAMSTWHFIGKPYNPENVSTDPVEAVNAVSVSLDMITSLQNTKAPLYLLNFAWVHLTHIIGDLHQPLHSVSMYSHEYPHGDLGGNLIYVRVRGKTVKLHALWDNICTATPPYYKRPLSYTDAFAISSTADRLMDKYRFPRTMRTLVDVAQMAEESYAFAVNSSYADMKPGKPVSDEYLARCTEVAESRLTLGGYRLGYILNDLLSKITVDQETVDAYRAAAPKRGAAVTAGRQRVRIRGHSH
ncbi:hypothetical protein GH5_02709 [Leishmania sp. Ghana 2012 LV757]|uniref:hypothetical protein n=1 Tax=Leishmania sp. Ghana 2012 LV757 TaxID=2803181 RepID=UPI001B54CFD0|nr:hypothetical protein GH5_02709 [Leishmania sp. Ghana 2012 LV757]